MPPNVGVRHPPGIGCEVTGPPYTLAYGVDGTAGGSTVTGPDTPVPLGGAAWVWAHTPTPSSPTLSSALFQFSMGSFPLALSFRPRGGSFLPDGPTDVLPRRKPMPAGRYNLHRPFSRQIVPVLAGRRGRKGTEGCVRQVMRG